MFDMLLDILNSLESDAPSEKDQAAWAKSLKALGVQEEDLADFSGVLEKIASLQTFVRSVKPRGGFSMRVYSKEECEQLDANCRGLLLYLEHKALLPPELRERVIQQAMSLKNVAIDELRLRLLILLVLFHPTSLDDMLSHYQALSSRQGAALH